MSRVSFSPPAPAPLPPLLSLPARKMRLGNGEERSLFLMHHRAEIPSLSFVLFRSRPSPYRPHRSLIFGSVLSSPSRPSRASSFSPFSLPLFLPPPAPGVMAVGRRATVHRELRHGRSRRIVGVGWGEMGEWEVAVAAAGGVPASG